MPPDEKRCVNPNKDGERCKRWRQQFSTQCSWHGDAPHVQNAIQRRSAEHAAKTRAWQKYRKEGSLEISGAEDVIEVLEERLGIQVQMARALDELVGKLMTASQMRYEHRAGEQLRGEVNVWLELNKQVSKLGSDYMKLSLDERKVRIAEAQARVLVGVIRAVLDRLDLNGDQRRIAARAVPEELERAAIEQGS